MSIGFDWIVSDWIGLFRFGLVSLGYGSGYRFGLGIIGLDFGGLWVGFES